ncbi:sulfatase [Candidatus Fermentibacteria bacterium]|nr:sulfatase [Candidatus Fermentibacteria bacterium]
MSTFKNVVKTSIIVGYLGGLAYAGIEGLQAILSIQMGPASKTIRSWQDFSASVAVPLAAYPFGAALAALLLSLLSYPLWARRARLLTPAGRVGMVTGIVASAAACAWAIMASNPFLNAAILFSASRILFNAQIAGGGILAGIGIGVIAYALCRRFSSRTVALTLAALTPSLVITAMLFLWAKRNLLLGPALWRMLAAFALLIIAFLVMLAVIHRLLSVLYRGHPGLVRALALPALIGALSIAAVSSSVTPHIRLLPGGPGGKGIKVILFTIDTLRADHLGCYGHHRDTSPVMDSLSAEGALFWHAYSQSPWTLSSIASFMTSTYPTVNRVLTGNNKLDLARITLAEQFQEHGILTQAIVTNGWLQDTFGIAQGFDGFHHSGEVFNWGRYQRMLWMRLVRRFRPDLFSLNRTFLAKDVVDRATEWIRLHHDRDFFLWIHSVDPHDPYDPPKEYRGLFSEAPYKGRFMHASGLLHPMRQGARLSPEDKMQLEILYDREIRYTDDQMGRLVEALRETGIWDQTLFIVGSDHGEEFWEHDGIMHGHTLYEDQLRVPLIMRMPGRVPEGLVIRQPVRLLDLMPTILDLYGVPGSPEMQGMSLLPLVDGADDYEAQPSFAEALLYFDELKSLTRDGFKLVLNPGSGKTMLFDLTQDPLERWDLARSDSAHARIMLQELQAWMETSEALSESIPSTADGAEAKIDAETEAQLRALGYLN